MRGPGMHAASLLLSGCKCFCTSLQLEFYSLIKIFKTVDIKEKELTVTEGPKNTYKADLENFQTYVPKREGFLSRHLMPEEIKINVLTSLEIQKESGLISKHTEVTRNGN
mmetsp:Transcript_2350/g.7034  ORF Transcript_2350/g.7034 Transcript_2350/m.7034 type:complete len:110 (+) Transcript_2350:463-792(+)